MGGTKERKANIKCQALHFSYMISCDIYNNLKIRLYLGHFTEQKSSAEGKYNAQALKVTGKRGGNDL